MQTTSILRLARWLLETFGSAIAFYICLRFWGLKTAIIVSIVTGVGYVAREIVRDKKVSPFTAFVAANVAIFGLLDLRYQSGFFIKLEPAFGNAAKGLFFVGSVLMKRPILIELAERAAGRSLLRAHDYLRALTLVWGAFFFARASAHVWLAYHVDLAQALVWRAVLGPLSFVAMFAVERGYRSLRFGERARVNETPPPS